MTAKELKHKEQRISKFFNSDSDAYAQRYEDKGISDSARAHVKHMTVAELKTVLDVGSGPGYVLLEMIKRGAEVGLGIDLSTDMIEVSKKKFEEEGIPPEKYQFFEGSFLDLNKENYPEIPERIDGISIHMVLCCHPDRAAMLDKSTEFKPRKIVLTVPRTWILLRIGVGIMGIFARLFGTFRPYIHSQKVIDKQLTDQGYTLVERKKSIGKVMSAYELKSV